jgi:hypothetical protein
MRFLIRVFHYLEYQWIRFKTARRERQMRRRLRIKDKAIAADADPKDQSIYPLW